jgi:hypothetical protein
MEGSCFIQIKGLHASQKQKVSDTCVIRTHAPEGIALAGQRVNHSAKVPVALLMEDESF